MEKIRFIRGESVKECYCHEGVEEKLISEGWERANKLALSPRDLLIGEAASLGLTFPGNISNAKLKELIEESKSSQEAE